MALDFCKECDHIVEGDTFHGVEITVNMLDGSKVERKYRCCKSCGTEVSGIPCEPEENPAMRDRK